MKMVTISHPDVGTVRVPASSVPHHAAAGWSVVADVPAPPRIKPRPAKKAEGDPKAKANPDAPDAADGSAS